MAKSNQRHCCMCSAGHHRCIICECVKQKRPCTNCRLRGKCENRPTTNNAKTSFINVAGDGNCLFRCIAYIILDDEEKHDEVRKVVVEHMTQNRKEYEVFMDNNMNYDSYLQKISKMGTWGTDVEIRAMAKIYDRQIFVRKDNKGKKVWIPQHVKLGEDYKCDHEKKFITLDLQNSHFTIIKTETYPLCNCGKENSASQSESDNGTQISGERETENLKWYGIEVKVLKEWVNEIYEEIRSWQQKNLFEPPKCEESKEFIQMKIDLLDSYVDDTHYASFALKFIMVLPIVMLQKVSRKASRKQNVQSLRRRLDHLKNGRLEDLLVEMRSIRSNHNNRTYRFEKPEDKVQNFAQFMTKGKINPALRLISDKESGRPLKITNEVRMGLEAKHPKAQEADNDIKIEKCDGRDEPYLFDIINEDMVWKKAMRTQGGAGPSGINADMMKGLLNTKKHGDQATSLKKAIARLARKLATEYCHNLDAYTARRLLALEKQPDGMRPIGIGEILNRIIGKCIMQVLRERIRKAAGNLQVCSGHQAGGEAAIHAMRDIFEEENIEAVILVDAKNAFNTINREAMLHNIKMKCPSFSKYVENTYGSPSELYIEGDEDNNVIMSEEGTTQGDPIAMAMYAIGLSVMQDTLSMEETRVKSVSYADDLIGAGSIVDLYEWWKKLETTGKKFGYLTNAKKSWIVVKPEKKEEVEQIFKDTSLQITIEGQKHLGAVIGSEEYKTEYVRAKVNDWINEIERLSEIAKIEPHAAYTAFTFGLKHKWTYVLRTIPKITELIEPLEFAIRNTFIPALMNRTCTDIERELMTLPPRMGGLGIINPSAMADQEYENSIKLTHQLKQHIIAQEKKAEVCDLDIQRRKNDISKERDKKQNEKKMEIEEGASSVLALKIKLASEVGASSWLTSLPIKVKGFSLNKREFCDALALRYGWDIEGLPDTCPGCQQTFDEGHAQTCKTGGYIAMRHDEVRDLTCEMMKEIHREVQLEPNLQPCTEVSFSHNTANKQLGARVDLSARGFWTKGQNAFFDVRIFEPTAQCYNKMTLKAIYAKNERDKIREYGERIVQVEQGAFTPLIFSTAGGMSANTQVVYNKIAEVMADKKGEPRGYFTAWLRVRLSFALLRSSLLCLRGTRYSRKKIVNVADTNYEMTVTEGRIDVM